MITDLPAFERFYASVVTTNGRKKVQVSSYAPKGRFCCVSALEHPVEPRLATAETLVFRRKSRLRDLLVAA